MTSDQRPVIKLTLALFILACCVPAFAGQSEIDVGPDWIKGKADAAPLGKVLAQVAEKAGYAIYIDEKLQKVPVTFTIKEKITPQRAIRRMVRPHSYAVVFGGEAEDDASNILEVWVFRKGQQLKARYVALKRTTRPSPSDVSGSLGKGDVDAASGAAASSEAPGAGVGRSIEGKNLLRRDLTVTRSIFGTPVIKSRDRSKGPDYRPNAFEMRQAYKEYQRAKREEERHRARAMHKQAQQRSEQERARARAQRNEELKQKIKDMKTKDKKK